MTRRRHDARSWSLPRFHWGGGCCCLNVSVADDGRVLLLSIRQYLHTARAKAAPVPPCTAPIGPGPNTSPDCFRKVGKSVGSKMSRCDDDQPHELQSLHVIGSFARTHYLKVPLSITFSIRIVLSLLLFSRLYRVKQRLKDTGTNCLTCRKPRSPIPSLE